MKPIRILIVDDHPSFQQAAAAALALETDFEVVGWATTGPDALALAQALRPDVVLLDVFMPGLNGWEVARKLKAGPRPLRVLIVSLQCGPEYHVAAAGVGADGFLCKADFGDQLADLVRAWFQPSRDWLESDWCRAKFPSCLASRPNPSTSRCEY